jgi:predicted HTH domain antitoxin
MPITIPDDILRDAGLTEREALIEIACRLYDAEKLDKTAACRLCGLVRPAFEEELYKRKLPLYHLSVEEFEQDMENIKSLERKAG